MAPTIVHQGGDAESTYTPGHLIAGLPNDWIVYSTPSGYQNKEGMRPWAVAFIRHSKASETNCEYVFWDGYDAHFDYETLCYLLANWVRVIFLRSQASIIDQPLDMGCNEMLDAQYNDAMNHWREKFPGVSFSSGFFNQVITEAWKNYLSSPNHTDVVQKAFANANIFPMIRRDPNIFTSKDIARAKICSPYITDEKDAETVKKMRHSLPDKENSSSTTVSFNQMPMTNVTVDTVSDNCNSDQYKFALRTAALDIIDRNLVTPAQDLRKIYLEIQANKSCRIPNNNGVAIKVSLKNPVFPTGSCVTAELLAILEARRLAKENKESEDKIKASSRQKKIIEDLH